MGWIEQGPAAEPGTPFPSLGLLYVPAISGQPTGVPDAHKGFVPVAFDTTNNMLWIYNDAWLGVAVR